MTVIFKDKHYVSFLDIDKKERQIQLVLNIPKTNEEVEELPPLYAIAKIEKGDLRISYIHTKNFEKVSNHPVCDRENLKRGLRQVKDFLADKLLTI